MLREMKNENRLYTTGAADLIAKVIGFLKLFMCETLAKRVIGMVLITVGLPNARVTELTGLCDKSVRVLRKSLESGESERLFRIARGGGRPKKLINVEQAIIEEVNSNTYHSQQQIADMVHDKFGLKVSADTVRRLLKKTASSD